jgi:hypothetical protein
MPSPDSSRTTPPKDNYQKIVRQIAENVLRGQRSRNIIVPRDFLELFVAEVGGPQRLARNLAQIVNDPKASSVAKSRVMSDILHLMAHVQKANAGNANIEDLDDADVEAMVRQIVADEKKDDSHAGPEPAGQSEAAAEDPDSGWADGGGDLPLPEEVEPEPDRAP